MDESWTSCGDGEGDARIDVPGYSVYDSETEIDMERSWPVATDRVNVSVSEAGTWSVADVEDVVGVGEERFY